MQRKTWHWLMTWESISSPALTLSCLVTGSQMIKQSSSDFEMKTRHLREKNKAGRSGVSKYNSCLCHLRVPCCHLLLCSVFPQLTHYKWAAIHECAGSRWQTLSRSWVYILNVFAPRAGSRRRKQRAPCCLLQGTPNVMSLQIPSGRHS